MKPSKLIPFILAAAALWLAFGPALPAIPWPVIGGGAPFQTDKLGVLIVEEGEKRRSLPPSQVTVITSRLLQDAVEKLGGELRRLDVSDDPSRDAPWVQAAWKVERKSLPWIVAANRGTGISQPLPATLDETFKALSPLGVAQ